MAVTSRAFPLAQQSLANRQIDFDTDVVRVILCTSTYVPADTHRYRSDVTNEVTGTNYAAGGEVLIGKTVTQDARTTRLSCSNISWPNSTITARYAVFFVVQGADLTTPTDDPLLCFWDFGADISSVTGPFNLLINAAGLVTLAA